MLEAPGRLDDVRRQLDEYFEGRRTDFELPIDWSLSRGLNQRILQATAKVPFGELATYRDMATQAGNERAVRAAGNALGSNHKCRSWCPATASSAPAAPWAATPAALSARSTC